MVERGVPVLVGAVAVSVAVVDVSVAVVDVMVPVEESVVSLLLLPLARSGDVRVQTWLPPPQ